MKRRLLALSAGLLLAGGMMPAPALAGGSVLDQHNETMDHWFGMTNPNLAQSFTVGMTGTLAGIYVRLFCSATTHIDITLLAVDASGLPPGEYLGSGWGGAATTDMWVYFATSAVHLTAGQHVAIVIHGFASCDMRGSTDDAYAGGMASYYGNGHWQPWPPGATTDWAFRTYMTPAPKLPIPAPVSLRPTAIPYPGVFPSVVSIASGRNQAPTSTSGQTEAAPTAASPSAAASATATPTTGTGGSGGSGGPPMAMIAAGVVVLGGLGCLLAFLLLRRRRSPAEVPPPQPATGRRRRSRGGGA